MGMQDVEVTGANTVVTNYGLGARGVDFIERVGTSTVTGFPIYDAHGNNVATLTRSGTTYSIGDQRSYDAWGGVRAQQNAGDPKLRYCASLGHKQDDESGLIYMQARYYEPGSGRFVSQDVGMDGLNWFVYCMNSPIQGADPTGRNFLTFMAMLYMDYMKVRNSGMPVALAVRYFLAEAQETMEMCGLDERMLQTEFMALAREADNFAYSGVDDISKEIALRLGEADRRFSAEHGAEADLIFKIGPYMMNMYVGMLYLDGIMNGL